MSSTLETASPLKADENGQVMLPAPLRDAAYVSAGGRVYRLFSEEEESSLNTEPFHLDSKDVPVFPLKSRPLPAAEDVAPTVQIPQMQEPLKHTINGLGDGHDDPKVFLKLFEAFSETSSSRQKKRLVAQAAPKIKIKEETLETEHSALRVSAPPVLPFSVLGKTETIPNVAWFSEPQHSNRVEISETEHDKLGTEKQEVEAESSPLTAGGEEPVPIDCSEFSSDSVPEEQPVLVDETPQVLCDENQEDAVPEAEAEVPQSSPERQHSPGAFIRVELRLPKEKKRLFSPRNKNNGKPRPQTPESIPVVPTEHTAVPKIKCEPPVRWPEHLSQLEETATEQVRLLADTLEEQHRLGRKTLSFNSIRLADGCTTLCLCAARELARRGLRVLLADAHKQHPELPDLLGLTIDPSLYELITLLPEQLDLLPWSEIFLEFDTENNGTTRTFAEIITSLREEYDVILLDHGCLTETDLDDPVRQWKATHTDGVLLVLNMRHPAPFDIKTVVRKLLLHEVEFIGVAENYV